MPDDPGPRPHLSRRALWVAPATVIGVVAVVAVAIRGFGAPDASSPTATPLPSVSTAPNTTAPTHAAEFEERPHVGPKLRPVTPGDSCAMRSLRTLRVLQFNIRAGVGRNGAVDLDRIAEEIAAVRPDLVSLNEVDSGTLRSGGLDEAAYLARATGLRAVYGPNLFYDGGLFGNAILTRFPVVESHNLRLPGVIGSEPRGMLTATLQVGRRTVSFSAMHLSDGSDGRASRIEQSESVARVVRHAPDATIVAGDLNSGPRDLPVRILRQYLLDSQEQGGVGRGATVPEPAPRSRFDYVFYDNRLVVVPGSTRVRPSSSSDHRSVFTKLTLREGC